MIRYLIILIICAIGEVGFSQNVKIKKGIVYVDKNEMARIEGGLSLKSDKKVTYKTLTNEELFTVTNRGTAYKHPDFDDRVWYDIQFSTGDRVTLTAERVHLSNKNLTENLISYEPTLFTGNPLNEEAIRAFTEKNDSTALIVADTAKSRLEIRRRQRILIDSKVDRETGIPWTLRRRIVDRNRFAPPSSWQTDKYYIMFGDLVVGGFDHTYNTQINKLNGQATVLVSIFRIYKKLDKAIVIDGEETDYLLAAYHQSDIDQYEYLVTMSDAKRHLRHTPTDDLLRTVKFLAYEGYL